MTWQKLDASMVNGPPDDASDAYVGSSSPGRSSDTRSSMPSSTGSESPDSEASPEQHRGQEQGDRDAQELYERQKFPKRYQDLHPDAQLLDRQLFQMLQTIAKGSLLSVISQLTGQYGSTSLLSGDITG